MVTLPTIFPLTSMFKIDSAVGNSLISLSSSTISRIGLGCMAAKLISCANNPLRMGPRLRKVDKGKTRIREYEGSSAGSTVRMASPLRKRLLREPRRRTREKGT